jgi:hypothetical protein
MAQQARTGTRDFIMAAQNHITQQNLAASKGNRLFWELQFIFFFRHLSNLLQWLVVDLVRWYSQSKHFYRVVPRPARY